MIRFQQKFPSQKNVLSLSVPNKIANDFSIFALRRCYFYQISTLKSDRPARILRLCHSYWYQFFHWVENFSNGLMYLISRKQPLVFLFCFSFCFFLSIQTRYSFTLFCEMFPQGHRRYVTEFYCNTFLFLGPDYLINEFINR